ncbi:MAG: DUF6049 family protein [Mobilicoccus sp.]|nr:DUF6049 family protein [Mobilicoccus sp.]
MRLVSGVRAALAVVFAASLAVPAGMPTPAAAQTATITTFGASTPAIPAGTPPPTSSTAVAPDQVAAASTGAMRIDAVTPQVAVPGEDVTVSVELHNTTTGVLSPTVEARVGTAINTRDAVADHAENPALDLPVLTTTTVETLAPGARTTVSLTLPADDLALRRPYGALPVTLTVTGLPDAPRIGTFIPYQVIKEYEPLRLAAALPLTADPDPRVLSGVADERLAAWTDMVAPGSRLDRVLRAAETGDVTVIVDPQLFGPADAGEDTPADDPRAGFADRVAAIDAWALPLGDPDLSALTAVDAISPRTPLPDAADTPLIAWPAGASGAAVRDTAARLGEADRSGPAAVIVPTPEDPSGFTGSAVRLDEAGTRVLRADRSLSAVLGTATSGSGPLLAQRALADSVGLLAESPGRARDAFVLPDRGLDPDPDALTAVLDALDAAPWITDVDAGAYLGDEPAPESVVDTAPPATTPASPLTRENADEVGRIVDLAAGLRPVLPGAVIPADLESTLVSTRWRGHVDAWEDAKKRLADRLDELSSGIYVVPSTINFFADHGALQVTVVNDLDVEVSDVHLQTTVRGRPSRLVVRSEPEPLTIRPRSRTTVRFDVEALAAGMVPITTSLRTPDGTPLGQDATVDVQVRPTNGWLLLAAGGVVGAVFFFGLLRAIRLGERRVSDSDMRDLDLT